MATIEMNYYNGNSYIQLYPDTRYCGGDFNCIGNMRLKGSGNYGNKLNFGDGDLVYLYEPSDDVLEIKAKNINFKTSNTSGNYFTLNGTQIGGGSSGIQGSIVTYIGTGTPNTQGPSINFGHNTRIFICGGGGGGDTNNRSENYVIISCYKGSNSSESMGVMNYMTGSTENVWMEWWVKVNGFNNNSIYVNDLLCWNYGIPSGNDRVWYYMNVSGKTYTALSIY